MGVATHFPNAPVVTLLRRNSLCCLAVRDAQGASRQLAHCHTPLASPSGAAIDPGSDDTLRAGGLKDHLRSSRQGSRLPELTKRTILLLTQTNPYWGCQKISDLLLRGPALPASASAVARVLHEAGSELEEVHSRTHPDTGPARPAEQPVLSDGAGWRPTLPRPCRGRAGDSHGCPERDCPTQA